MVLIGIPSYDGRIGRYTFTSIIRASGMPGVVGGFQIEASSLLTWNLNKIMAHTLNQDRKKVTHLCLLHDDIELDQLWLDKMLKIMAEKKADILSVVMSMKNDLGHTSTAVYEKDQMNIPAHMVRRLDMKEVIGRGGTFTADNLLVNTGVMLMDLRGEWIEGMYFTMQDCIVKNKEGKLMAQTFSEDWDFSKRAQERGAKIWATNAVRAWHHGGGKWSNQVESVAPTGVPSDDRNPDVNGGLQAI